MPWIALRAKCMNEQCQKEFVLELPEPDVVNGPSTCAIVWHKRDNVVCPECGAEYVYILAGVEQLLPVCILHPAPPRREKSVIVVPGAKFPV